MAGAVALARELERRHPDLITAAWWKEERGSRVFIDFNQNAPHKTVFGAWSVRPRNRGAGEHTHPVGRRSHDRARRAHDQHGAGLGWGTRAARGLPWRPSPNPSSRYWRCRLAIVTPDCRTHPGRLSTRRCRTSRAVSLRAVPARSRNLGDCQGAAVIVEMAIVTRESTEVACPL